MDQYIGEIRMVGFNFAPMGWALCNGQTLSVTANQALFALIGATYGGDGRTTFNLPDLQGRVPINVGNGAGLPAYTWGQKGGAASVALQAANLPAHTHPIAPPVSNVKATSNNPVGAFPALGAATVVNGAREEVVTPLNYAASSVAGQTGASFQSGAAGSGTPVSIEPPFLAVYFIIATEGIFPTRS